MCFWVANTILYLISVRRNFVFIDKIVKFWLKSCKCCFIDRGAFICFVCFHVGQENCLKCGSPGASECRDDLSRRSAQLCRVAQLNAGLFACQGKNKKQLEKDNNGCSCPMAPLQTRVSCQKFQHPSSIFC